MWEKWNFEEIGRVEMLLINDNDEIFFMGLVFDLSLIRLVIEGEKRFFFVSIMMFLLIDGVLCLFYMVN